ncbi:four-helix bundle copper-binding protein [Roseisolibacter sp. H3M3-2]|uniref:four-helix bundle copper-binding protein n=1 Tax=Roseisolibacter sp. H3M3-2 TaxID=3031323 RepID=UPI0031F31C05
MQDHMRRMLRAHPAPVELAGDEGALLEAIEACVDCALTCSACADACLAEPGVAELRACIRLNQDCADICDATGRILARLTAPDSPVVGGLLRACLAACQACGAECERHAAHHDHCRACAEACLRCEEACGRLLARLPGRA